MAAMIIERRRYVPKKIVLWLILIISVFQLFAQNDNTSEADYLNTMESRVILANAVKNYPVTPGDVYKLSYMTAGGIQSLEITVQGDFSLNLSVFGKLSAQGLTYQELRTAAENLVNHAYPGSKPSFIIISTGIFQIYLKGEVKEAGYVNCWGLSRLSEVIAGKTTAYSSLRDIEVIAENGAVKTYDLFSALSLGKRDEDPYVKPDNTVVVKKVQRQVKIFGEIFRPGTYQLLASDGLEELISNYGGGFTNLSDPTRIRIVRFVTEEKQKGEAYYLSSKDSLYKDFILHNLDEVYIPSKKDSLPVVYFEGALDLDEKAAVKGEELSEKYTYRFVEGQKLSSALQELYNKFSSEADLKRAYIIRSGEDKPIAVDIEALIHNYDASKDIVLVPYDRVIIPFRQYFVTVSGAVFRPGHYPYMPNRSYKYYLQLAGGTDPQKNIGEKVIITDMNDTVFSQTRIIQPEDIIYAEYNNPLYHANQWAVIIGTAVSVTALVLTIIQLSK
jgi:polysaccharide export outer membrane protein